MREPAPFTETLSCDLGAPVAVVPNQETEFEKRRGVSRVEIRSGFAQVHVMRVPEPLAEGRVKVLDAVAQAGTSIDFLKLSPTGLSFLIQEERAAMIEAIIAGTGADASVQRGRSIILVHAVNIRDEEGMIALLIRETIGTGARVDHVGDMHDRLLMVVPTSDSDRVADELRNRLRELANAD